MVAWRAHMDDQAEEDLHHEAASFFDSVDSTPTGSVDSGRSTASEARQPLLCQLDVTGSNRSASAVKHETPKPLKNKHFPEENSLVLRPF